MKAGIEDCVEGSDWLEGTKEAGGVKGMEEPDDGGSERVTSM